AARRGGQRKRRVVPTGQGTHEEETLVRGRVPRPVPQEEGGLRWGGDRGRPRQPNAVPDEAALVGTVVEAVGRVALDPTAVVTWIDLPGDRVRDDERVLSVKG